MRQGNSSYDKSQSSYNPEKSYELASWQDYVMWLNRIGYFATFRKDPHTVTVTEVDGTVHQFTSKRDIFYWLIGEEYE